MSLLIQVDTLKELSRLLTLALKSAGHAKYFDTTQRSFVLFETSYKESIHSPQCSVENLLSFEDTISPLVSQDNKQLCDEVKYLATRIQTEIQRLIATHQQTQMDFIIKEPPPPSEG